jgi:hypothetical protein
MVKPLKQLFFLLSALLTVAGSYAQVNLQTGSATYSIPLYQYSDVKSRISLPVILNYHSGNGLRVNEVASNIGTGWNLQCGGMIVRMQIGQPDDQPAKEGSWNDLAKYPPGYLYAASISSGCPTGMSFYPIFGGRNQVYKQHNEVEQDREQDKFAFTFNGRSGVFVIGRNRQVRVLGDTRLTISFIEQNQVRQLIRTTISQFTVTDENGVQYIFRDKLLSRTLRYRYVRRYDDGTTYPYNGEPDNGDGAVNTMQGFPLDEAEIPYIVNGWYLSEIKDPFNKRAIQFNYTGTEVKGFAANQVSVTTNYLSNEKSQVLLLQNNTVQLVKNLASVNCPDGVTLNFTYGDNRFDLTGDKMLSRISIADNGNTINSWQFTQSYFIKNSIALPLTGGEKINARLCLTAIQQVGSDGLKMPPYRFSYYTGTAGSADDIVPPPHILAQDRWGYYNGNTNGVPLENGSNISFAQFKNFTNMIGRNAKAGYAQNGLLKAITLPSGGSLQYRYQQSRDDESPWLNNYTGGVSVSKLISYDGTDSAKNIVKAYQYIRENGRPSGWGYETWENERTTRVHYQPNLKIYDPVTGCDYRLKYPGIQYPELASGLNAAEIKKMVSDVVSYLSFSFNIMQIAASSGATQVAGIVTSVYGILVTAAFTCNDVDYIKDYTAITRYGQNLNAPASLPFLYDRVEETDASPGAANGKTVYTFTGQYQSGLKLGSIFYGYPYPARQRLADWATGLPTKITVLDKDGTKVEETENSLQVMNREITDTGFLSCKCDTKKQWALSDYDWTDNPYYKSGLSNISGTEGITMEFYTPWTGRSELTNTRLRIYAKSGQVQETFSRIEYHPKNLQVKTKYALNRYGDTIQTRYYYPEDYTTGGVLQTLAQSNAVNTPVSVEIWQHKGNNYFLLSAEITEYQSLANGSIAPVRTYSLETDQPVPLQNIGVFDPARLVRNNQYFKPQAFISYNKDGLPAETRSQSRVSSSIYDYQGRYTIAMAAGAANSDIAYTGFEADGTGNWTYNTSPANYDRTQSMTGKAAYRLSNSAAITKTNLNPATTYIVTVWATESGVQVNGQYGTALRTINNWTLYQFTFSGTTAITIGGYGVVDDVRLHPQGALMTTYTYDPGIGKTSETGSDNRIQYMDYDGLGRMIQVRDEQRNIIKTIEYNYKN